MSERDSELVRERQTHISQASHRHIKLKPTKTKPTSMYSRADLFSTSNYISDSDGLPTPSLDLSLFKSLASVCVRALFSSLLPYSSKGFTRGRSET